MYDREYRDVIMITIILLLIFVPLVRGAETVDSLSYEKNKISIHNTCSYQIEISCIAEKTSDCDKITSLVRDIEPTRCVKFTLNAHEAKDDAYIYKLIYVRNGIKTVCSHLQLEIVNTDSNYVNNPMRIVPLHDADGLWCIQVKDALCESVTH
jgi:hypothetical protein